MDNFSIGKIIAGLRNPEIYLRKIKQKDIGNNTSGFNTSLAQQNQNAINRLENATALLQQLQMNRIASMDRAIFIRNLLGLPQTLSEILISAQNKNAPLNNTTLLLNDLNENLLKNQKMISQLFDEQTELPTSPTNLNSQQIAQTKDSIMSFFSGMINMPEISKIILKNSKQAVANLIISMASASKEGLTSDQIRETLAALNSCIALADSNNPTQTLKSLMLLYLPWLPLNEGVGFDLEVTPQEGENESNDSKLTVLIQTVHFGNVKGVFTLTTSNSVEAYILCSEDFPQNTLLKNLQEESSSHAMNSSIDIETVETKKKNSNEKVEAKVNLSATNEMNPYLLLMAHSFIRNTIYIDSNYTENSDNDDNNESDTNS